VSAERIENVALIVVLLVELDGQVFDVSACHSTDPRVSMKLSQSWSIPRVDQDVSTKRCECMTSMGSKTWCHS